MSPGERAQYFTLVDQLQPEDLTQPCQPSALDIKLRNTEDYDGIPNSLAEIFEISNANRRLNK